MHYPHKTTNSHHNAEPSLLIQPCLLSMIAFSSSIVSLRNFYRIVMINGRKIGRFYVSL